MSSRFFRSSHFTGSPEFPPATDQGGPEAVGFPPKGDLEWTPWGATCPGDFIRRWGWDHRDLHGQSSGRGWLFANLPASWDPVGTIPLGGLCSPWAGVGWVSRATPPEWHAATAREPLLGMRPEVAGIIGDGQSVAKSICSEPRDGGRGQVRSSTRSWSAGCPAVEHQAEMPIFQTLYTHPRPQAVCASFPGSAAQGSSWDRVGKGWSLLGSSVGSLHLLRVTPDTLASCPVWSGSPTAREAFCQLVLVQRSGRPEARCQAGTAPLWERSHPALCSGS